MVQMDCIRVECRRIRHQHVLTSPDLPGLYVASRDAETAYRILPSALAMLERQSQRRSGSARA